MPLTLVPPKAGRTPNYHIRGTYLGIAVNRSAGTSEKRLAGKIRRRIEDEIERGAYTPAQVEPIADSTVTFLGSAVAYMKAGGERTFLGPIIEYTGPYAIRDRAIECIGQLDLDNLADALYPHATAQTRNRQVYTPIAAVLHGAGIERKFKRPKGWRGKKSKSKLEPEQAFALLHAAEQIDAEFGLLCTTLLYTGRRISDALSAKLRDLNLDRAELYLPDTKNGEDVTVHLPPFLVEKFRTMPPRQARPSKASARRGLRRGEAGRSQLGAGVPFLKRHPDERIFRFHQGGHLRDLLAEATRSAGLSFPRRQGGFHLFCHTYATWMARYGKLDNFGLARTGRWKDPRSAEGYLHTVVGSEAKLANLLPTPKREHEAPKRAKPVQSDQETS
jgi:integrase